MFQMTTIKKFDNSERLVFLKENNGKYFVSVYFGESSQTYSRTYKRLDYALNMFSTYVGYPEKVIRERRYF